MSLPSRIRAHIESRNCSHNMFATYCMHHLHQTSYIHNRMQQIPINNCIVLEEIWYGLKRIQSKVHINYKITVLVSARNKRDLPLITRTILFHSAIETQTTFRDEMIIRMLMF